MRSVLLTVKPLTAGLVPPPSCGDDCDICMLALALSLLNHPQHAIMEGNTAQASRC